LKYPILATRVKRDIYDFYHKLAKLRIERVSDIVRKALDEYKEKTETIEKEFTKNE